MDRLLRALLFYHAGLVAFLASADSDYLTGQAINIDGGLVMGS